MAEAGALRLLDKVGLGQFKDHILMPYPGSSNCRHCPRPGHGAEVMLYDEPTSASIRNGWRSTQVMRDLHAEA